MLKKILLIFVISFFPLIQNAVFCQYQNVLISSQYYPDEVSIMINPKNPNQVVAGSNIYTGSYDSSRSGYYYSTNGGLNWYSGVLRSSLRVPYGDPVILVDTTGKFYFIQNSNSLDSISPNKHLVMKSSNAGVNWFTASVYGVDGKMQDKPWGCVDWSKSVWRNNIYITYTEFSYFFGLFDSTIIRFVKSSDGGLNWSQPMRISKRKGDARDSSNTMEGAVPCTGPNGEIYVSWSGPISMYSGQYAIFFNKSTDGGNTWLDSERVATTQPGGWSLIVAGTMRCNGFPVTCCDLSNGPHRGTVYINFSDQRNGTNNTDVWLIKSTNGGQNWSSVKRVNNDATTKHQFFTWMTVDQTTGYLYFVFYDQRNTASLKTDVYIARSTDGGETFQNSKVNTTTINLYTNYFIGDYTNISAVNGHIRPIWTGTNNTIYTAIVDTFYTIGINKIGEKIPTSCDLMQNYPNPFNPNTDIRFQIKDSKFVTLKVYDVLGKEIETLVDEKLQAGVYEVPFYSNEIASGIYFYKLTVVDPLGRTGDYTAVKRMVMIK
jgi:hypothetical protein